MYAEDLDQIPTTLAAMAHLRSAVIDILSSHAIHAKALVGGAREQGFRAIMVQLANGQITIATAIDRVKAMGTA